MASSTIVHERTQPTRTSRRASRRSIRGRTDLHYQSLLCRLQSVGYGMGGERRTIGLTSCLRREGVSTVVGNLAVQASLNPEAHILVVDANIANPKQHKLFQVDLSPGLSTALGGDVILEECVQSTTISNIRVVTAGTDQNFGGSNFPPKNVLQMIESVAPRFDLIIVDLPAVSVPTNQSSLIAGLDGLLIVLEAERISNAKALRNMRQIRESGANLLGVVFNKYRNYIPKWLARFE